MYSLTDYDYYLPQSRIAQKPLDQRDCSKLLRLNRKTEKIAHHCFNELDELLSSTDVIVVNNTQVIPGRLIGRKKTGGKAEVLILNYDAADTSTRNGGGYVCDCLINASKRAKPGAVLIFDEGVTAVVLKVFNEKYRIRFSFEGNFESMLYRIGRVPLPHYINRDGRPDELFDDTGSYQTVYASQKGAVAAPTAGLHFTETLINRLRLKGIKMIPITLHIGYGTFAPVRVPNVQDHKMHSERFHISQSAADAINHAKNSGGRIVSVGTSCVRTLEFSSDHNGVLSSGSGDCNLFIYPGYRFKIVDAMITNFHLPKSTLLMLVSAFAGYVPVMNAYQEAIAARYRFYSYGDAMVIE